MVKVPLVIICGLFGLVIGSFLNVVIYRVPRDESIARPPSHCPSCSTPLAPYDNIPVLSYLILRGKCRHCRATISVRYPLVEALTGALFASAAVRFGYHLELAAYCVLAAFLVALSGIDLDTRLLPRRIVYLGTATGVVLLGAAAGVGGTGRPVVDAAIGAAVGFGALFLVHFVSPQGMGFGDVRLAGMLGLYLGFLGVAHVGVGLFAGFVLGAVVGLALMGLGRAGRRSRIPFGPFLAAGAWVAVLWGDPLVRLWLGPR